MNADDPNDGNQWEPGDVNIIQGKHYLSDCTLFKQIHFVSKTCG